MKMYGVGSIFKLSKEVIVEKPEFHDISYKFNIMTEYLKENCKLLDIGCWNGNFVLSFCKVNKIPQIEILGIDFLVQAIRCAHEYVKGVTFLNASALKLPFRDKIFDIISLWDVIEHLPVHSELKALSEINRVLKKKGVLFLSVYNYHPTTNLLDPAYLLGHTHYNINLMKNFLKAAGFEIVQVDLKEGWGELISALALYFYKHLLKKPRPKFYENLINKGFKKKGFVRVFIIAEKRE